MSHLFRRQTHLELRLSVLELINFKTASLGVYFLMSNSSFSANNFSSIDSEFGLTTNTNTTKTMNNQTTDNNTNKPEINMNNTTDFDLESGATSINVKSATPVDQLNEASTVPTWEVITDEERTLVQAANDLAA